MPSINTIISNISNQNISLFFESKITSFKPEKDVFTNTVNEEAPYSDPIRIGHAELKNHEELLVFTCEYNKELTARSAKKQQFEIAKKVLKEDFKDGAIFVFYDEQGNFRFSFIRRNYGETGDKKFSTWKRYTYYVEHSKQNKTFKNRIENCHFDSLNNIQEAFSVQPLNKQFYQQVAKSFYELISGKYKLGNKSITVNQPMLELPYTPYAGNETIYKEFAVRLIGRTIFCWFLKNKKSNNGIPIISSDWLSTNSVIKEAEKNRDYYHSILERLFFIVLNKKHADREPYELPDGSMDIPFLNGGLFEPDPYDFFSVNNKNIHITNYALKIPNEWFKNLFETLEQYNFTIDENSINDTEVSIDPEMLGTIFENLLAEIDPDTEKSARKSTGSFYTPREIVDYMVEQSMVQYLKTKTTVEDEQELLQLFQEGQATTTNPNFTENESKQLLEALSTVKILDPACGSGAFPMGALHKICLALEKLDPNAVWWKEQQVKLIPNATAKKQLKEKLDKSTSDYARKLGVIQNSIYGVDIQPIAAEISKLRSFLSLVIDENIDDEADNRGIEPLPNLEFKFVTANTLIGLPEEQGQQVSMFDNFEQLEELAQLRVNYLQCSGDKKEKIKERFLKVQKKAFTNEHNLFADQNSRSYKIISWNPFKNEPSSWFDPQWMFGVEKFDVVIGNPPYVQNREVSEQLQKEYLKSKYYKYAKGGRLNLYQFFIPASTFLVKENGIVCLITQNSILAEDTAINTRKFIFNKSKVIEFVSFPERDNVNKRVFRGVKMSVAISLFQKKIKTKLKQSSFTVKTYAEKQMHNEFSIELTEEDIKKVYPESLIIPMAKGNSWELLKKFNSTKNQIKFKAQAGEIDMTKYSEYFNSTDGLRVYTGAQILRYSTTETPSQGEVIYLPSKYIPETQKAKARYKSRLVLQRITGVDSKLRLIVTKIPKDSLCANSTNFILFENEAYQLFSLGVLNSKLINYIFKITSTNTNITTSELNNLPLPNYSEKIEKIVKTILKKKNQNETTLIYENEIDIIVYRLYGLTYREVLTVDPTFSLTQEEYDNYNIES